MMKLSDFVPASNKTAGDQLRDLAEQRFAQYRHELRQRVPDAGRRLEADLKTLVRAFATQPDAADYLGAMLMVALVSDTGLNALQPMYNRVLPAANRDARTQAGRSKGGAMKPSKLPDADALRAELDDLRARRQISEVAAKGIVRRHYDVSPQALNRKLAAKKR